MGTTEQIDQKGPPAADKELRDVLSMALDELWWTYRPKGYGSLCCCMCDANISEAEDHMPNCYHHKLTAIYERVNAAPEASK